MTQVISFEDFANRHGAGCWSASDPALHRQPGSTEKERTRHAKRQWQRGADLLATRVQLQEQYDALVAAGEIRPPTHFESMIRTAQGHPDNATVQAARRILAKRGIPWEQDEPNGGYVEDPNAV